MESIDVKDIIEENYSLNIKGVKKVKNTYRIETDEGEYCIKVIRYKFSHFYFILSAILYLQKRGFETIPPIIRANNGEYYIEFFGGYAYLTKWINARESNFDNPLELLMVSEKLAELHNSSEGFSFSRGMEPRIGWFSWINVFNTRKNEILDFQHRISQKAYKSKFDELYLSSINDEVERAEQAIELLKQSNYIKLMEKEVIKRGFCHHDYANHNILINSNSDIFIIDFDYCIMDTHLHDLSSLFIRSMKNGKWSKSKAELILKGYCKKKDVTREEMKIMKEFIRFPQSFWQIGLQMYWEMQPWSEEFFINKLNKYLKDREERENFIEEFFV
ncbi:MAG: CotS family spore coat protein [Clostridiaceae bacterium]|nr:CotS family spore coat protein [Clostridiaceae bacterium]